jgi:hypothetical protein
VTAEFEVRMAGPVDVRSSLELFRRSGDDLIDRWDGDALVRTVCTKGGAVAYAGLLRACSAGLEPATF